MINFHDSAKPYFAYIPTIWLQSNRATQIICSTFRLPATGVKQEDESNSTRTPSQHISFISNSKLGHGIWHTTPQYNNTKMIKICISRVWIWKLHLPSLCWTPLVLHLFFLHIQWINQAVIWSHKSPRRLGQCQYRIILVIHVPCTTASPQLISLWVSGKRSVISQCQPPNHSVSFFHSYLAP